MAAEELQNTSKVGKMSVYAVLWVDPAMKKCTRVLYKAGKNPVWNDRVSLSLVNPTLLSNPHSTLTVQVGHHRPHLMFATLHCVPVALRFFYFGSSGLFWCFFYPITESIICSLFACVACGQVFSHGRINDTLVGTTYVSLSEIARMNAMRVDPDEGNILTLPLHRPSGRIQGSISLWINLSGNEAKMPYI